MNIKTKGVRIFLGGVLAVLAVILGIGFQHGTALAVGFYSYTPMNLDLGLSYNSSTQQLAVTGSIQASIESFKTQGGGCAGTPFGVYNVTGSTLPDSGVWSIINAAGSQIANGTTGGGFYGWYADPASDQTYNFPCASQSLATVYDVSQSSTLDMSSFAPGTYTLETSVWAACVASFPDGFCAVDAPSSTWSGSFTVPPVVGSVGGTINVMSEDSQTGSAVTSSFDVLDGSTDLCDVGGSSNSVPCTAQTQSFNKSVPLGTTATVLALSGSAGDQYALREVKEQLPIAQKKKNVLEGLFALSKSLLAPTANALDYCGYLDANSSQCALPYTLPAVNSLTPTAADPTANFIILWDPQASMRVATSSEVSSLSAKGTIETITVSNTSNAPGSELGWTATPTCAGIVNGNCPNANWISVSPSSNANPAGVVNGSPETATVNYLGGLTPGTYEVNVKVEGCSIVGNSSENCFVPPTLLLVTLTVTNAGGPPFFSCGGNQCVETATPGATSCDSACGLPPSTPPTVICTPSLITTAETSTCGISLNGTPQTGDPLSTPPGSGTITNPGGVYTPSGPGTITIIGTLPDGGSASTTITVTAPPTPMCNNASCQATCNNPVLNANPGSIVVPESSNLTYGCANVTSCTLSGGGLDTTQTLPSQGNITGNATATPSITTTYTLNCSNGNYSSDSASSTITVTVGGSGVCEQNPNGAGCPGH